ncbi:MAG: AMP-binding protein [Gammaproteobacteria bacterium]|nr:AMP-binding protein [Gammaproteobacteria bacterium]
MPLSYVSGCGAVPLLGETIGQNLERIARSFPSRDALVALDSGRRWSYAELNAEVDMLARALLGEGVEPGDRIGIWAPNCPEWVLAQYATAKIGAVLVCINPAYREHELRYVLRQSGVAVLLAVMSNRGADYRSMIVAARRETPDLRRVVYIDDLSWAELIAEADKTPAKALQDRAAQLSLDDPINIQFTSGTTGWPKGATLTHHNILNNGYFVGELLHYSEHDRICVPVPFSHCFGMVMGNLAATSHGAAIIIPGKVFDAATTLRAVHQERCTALYGVPTMFIAALAAPESHTLDLTSLRTGIMAGAPCPIAVMREVIDRLHMPEVAICYGMTETSPVSTMTRSDDDLRRRTETVGRVMPHVQIKIVAPATDQLQPRGIPGELCTRGYSVMRGYWRDSEQTRQALDEAGWMHTGDLAVMDEDGYISIVGRIKDMVIRGGENIYPREIEEFLFTHPDIAEVQVIGVPDQKYGEEVMACIRLRDGTAPMTVDALRAFCEGRLARYKIPRYLRVMNSFPMTVTGKIRKVELREEAKSWLASTHPREYSLR